MIDIVLIIISWFREIYLPTTSYKGRQQSVSVYVRSVYRFKIIRFFFLFCSFLENVIALRAGRILKKQNIYRIK